MSSYTELFPTCSTDEGRTAESESIPRVFMVKADNADAMTYGGTNTWIVAERKSCIIVDPGPFGHMGSVLSACRAIGGDIEAILTTHAHCDHDESAEQMSNLLGAPWLSEARGSFEYDDHGIARLTWGERLRLAILKLPGHTPDSVAFYLSRPCVLLTGDILFSEGPSVVGSPEGDLSEYFNTLRKLEAVARRHPGMRLLPGHGRVVDDPIGVIRESRKHRFERLKAVENAVVSLGLENCGNRDQAILQCVYGNIDSALRDEALASIRAQLEYLRKTRRCCHAGDY